MLSMVAAGAHTPREKTLRPFLSCTTQWSPASLTRRVRAALADELRRQAELHKLDLACYPPV